MERRDVGVRSGWAVAWGLVLWVGACEGPPEAPPPAVSPPSPSAPAAEVPEPQPAVEDPTFRLALADAGEQGVQLTLEARGGYHINQEFPFAATLSSDTAKLVKSELGRDDALEFGETHATFPVAAELPTGTHEISASVRFAVCTEDTCIPDKRTLALRVTR